MYYYMRVLLGPDLPYYRHTLRCSSPILGGYTWVFKFHIIGVLLSPQVLYYRGILRSSNSILQGYPWILKFHIIGVLLGLQVLYYRGTVRCSSPIFWGYLWVLISHIIGVSSGAEVLYQDGTVTTFSYFSLSNRRHTLVYFHYSLYMTEKYGGVRTKSQTPGIREKYILIIQQYLEHGVMSAKAKKGQSTEKRRTIVISIVGGWLILQAVTGTLGSSSPILQGYPQVLKSYIFGIPFGPQVLCYGGTQESPSPIFSGYSWVVKSYIRMVPSVPQGLYCGAPLGLLVLYFEI